MKPESNSATAKRIASFAHWTKEIALNWGACWLALAIVLELAVATTPSAQAQTFKVLHTFTGSTTDGANPRAGLVMDAKGNLYGTTQEDGSAGAGTVFEVSKGGKEKLLYSFKGGTTDGLAPYAGLVPVVDSKGNFQALYGTTYLGGTDAACSAGCGTVFQLTAPTLTTPSWTETALYSFTGGTNDGQNPEGGLVPVLNAEGKVRALYGTTYLGGGTGGFGDLGCGTVFELPPAPRTGPWAETALYSFGCKPAGQDPYAGLIVDAKGNLYGTTVNGGTSGDGTVFKLNRAGVVIWSYSFTGGPTDGEAPEAGLVMDAKGNLYGTTAVGGASGDGTVFEVSGKGKEIVLYSFAGGPTDGEQPEAGLVMDATGNLYGATVMGGASNLGTVFERSTTGAVTLLHSFTGGTDGATPYAGLIMDASGNLYGTAFEGGASNFGTVFELTPAP